MRFPVFIPVFLLGGLLAAGCGGGTARFIPPEQTSRQALETALTAWQEGKPPGPVADGKPSIQAVDSKWRAGQKLSKWEIVGEESSQGPTFFSVRLTLKGVTTPQVVRYVVVGRDPLWVYREDDYRTNNAGM